jgi:hypothetical protein
MIEKLFRKIINKDFHGDVTKFICRRLQWKLPINKPINLTRC